MQHYAHITTYQSIDLKSYVTKSSKDMMSIKLSWKFKAKAISSCRSTILRLSNLYLFQNVWYFSLNKDTKLVHISFIEIEMDLKKIIASHKSWNLNAISDLDIKASRGWSCHFSNKAVGVPTIYPHSKASIVKMEVSKTQIPLDPPLAY